MNTLTNLIASVFAKPITKMVDDMLVSLNKHHPEIVQTMGHDNARRACYFWLATHDKFYIKPSQDKIEKYKGQFKLLQSYLDDVWNEVIPEGTPLEIYMLINAVKKPN